MNKQQSKRRKLIGIVALVAILGGIITMGWFNGDRDNKSENNYYQVEKDLAMEIISEFEGVKEISFLSPVQSKETGYWGTTAIINKTNEISYSFSMTFSGKLDDYYYHFNKKNFKLTERHKKLTLSQVDLTGIDIKYSDGGK
ncbi:membrane protein [Streptococcus equi subsp. zooepidemicus]|nr:membrane protein [Streptococcus equi subsp. zooepidemicus]SUO82386.1 membrane protein [Streptococcus equi subsp. zooepidemicus]